MHWSTPLALLAAPLLVAGQGWNFNMGLRRFSGIGTQTCRGNNLRRGENWTFDTVNKECCLRLWTNGDCLGRQDFEICGDQRGEAGETFGSFAIACSRLLPIQRRDAALAAASEEQQ